MDLFLEAGALLYLWGAFVFKKTDDEPQLMSKAVLLFSLGGLCFFTSATYLHKLYFWQATSQKLASDEMDSSAGIEM